MGHHRYRITVEARMEAPESVPDGQVPTDESVTQALKEKLQGLDLGSPYKVYVDDMTYKKKKLDR